MVAPLIHLNYQLFRDINTYAGHQGWLDAIMIFCANLLIFLWPLLLLLFWGRPLSWRKRALRPGEAEIAQECRAVVLWVGIACLLAYAFNLATEQIIFEPRPFITHQVHLLIMHPADDSFPSDHTAWSFAVVGMMVFSLPTLLQAAWRQRMAVKPRGKAFSLVFPLLLMGVALIMACCIGVARVFVGVHYPGDIAGGALSGLFAAAIISYIRRRILQRPTIIVVQLLQRFHLA